ncbi:MAG TPA: NCS1 family nucleobase:cation symporter-1 [candidate division Zixibacteria bacterium]|nr:NCS1 family nucleobase:cation symporter-1 [candidate division Zixibacteria bacterium]
MTAAAFEEVVHPDGRHELTEQAQASIAHSPLYNEDLAPVRIERRTWTTYAYMALWIGMSINIPSWLLASGLIAVGMDWFQAILTIALGNLIVLVPMLLNSHAGTKYGIPFPVFARASFGTIGANIAALLRAGVACGWFGIQTWIGGTAIFTLVGAIAGSGWSQAAAVFGQPWTLWLSFLIFWGLNVYIIVKGMETLRIFESWSAPLLIGFSILLTIWMMVLAAGEPEGIGSIFQQPSQVGWGAGFWLLFFPSLMGMIAFWSTLSLNMPDFTRFGRGQREQIVGQALGLPTTMTLFAVLAVLTTSATIAVFGEAIWDPVALVARLGEGGGLIGLIVVVLSLFAVALATLTTNVAANLVSPSYDFSNAWPRMISFRTGGLITAVIGIVIQPWNLLSNPNVYIFTWLGFYGGALGTIAGVLIADYWIVRRTQLRLGDLYRTEGAYRYTNGFNLRGLVAFAIGALLAVGGAYSAPGNGPFPEGGLIGFLKFELPWGGFLYDYSWVVGLIVAFLVYWVLATIFPMERAEPVPTAEPAVG